MNFKEALYSLHDGEKVTRKGWDNKDIYVASRKSDTNPKNNELYISGKNIPWIAFEFDLLANDWYVVQ